MRFALILVLLATPAWAEAPPLSPRPAPRAEIPADRPLAPTPAAAITDQARLDRWLDGYRARARDAGIDAATLNATLPGLRYLPEVIRLDRNQSEFTKTIWDYLDTAVSDLRVRNGRAAMARYAEALARIEDRHGVPAEIVTAIWGVESSYGAYRGNVPTLAALATLAADSRRGAFFEEQLTEALRIVQLREVAPAAMLGSWAGAMGHTQFLPTSWRDHAQDFDGDGRRNLWGTDPRDALESTAAYLRANGWTPGQPWGVEVILPDGFEYRLTGERVEKTAAEWAALGVTRPGGGALPDAGPISIRVPAGHEGAAFATYGNFRALESYNTADAYVIGVGHLADRLAGGPPLVGGWPRQDRALSFDERIAMQEGLRAAGFDPLKIDAKIGPDTLDAIQRWQTREGLVPDGYVDVELLSRLLGG
ncbi:lytic murein transglycosylase [Jannaschia sp. GRR-S6-38]|uniref:Lytic murein transglycosylase n=2 Tax=Jannaschia ovalis TaxID=3038773 RepID=A0ABY8LI35_9RHOB|nr:lytic murein transglycosylase [Jannaschia sp. GRR-S6-38]WGH79820.1 lytic murein transglycosylase [Jannaschia sp. GRR-S6-38]